MAGFDSKKSSDIKVTEIDTIFLDSQVISPFCILWSEDNKISVNVEGGVFIFELWPTPLSEFKPSITFLKSWIPSSTSAPLSDAVVENENGSFLWSLNRKQAYEVVIDTTLSSSVERPNSCGILPYFVQCEFSPLINNRSYLSCLSNTGVLEIYKDQLKKWVPVVNVTELWISHCNFQSEKNEIEFNIFKSRMFQLKIITLKWVEEPEVKFITGHENGMIVFWNVSSVNDDLNIRVEHTFCVDEKPECIRLCGLLKDKSFLVVGFRSGVLKCFLVNLITGEKNMELTLWENKDSIVPKLVIAKILFETLFIVTIKRHIILAQNLLINTNQLELIMTKWEECSTAITGWDEYHGMFILSLQNHDMYIVTVIEDDDKKFMLDFKQIDIEIKDKQKTSFGSFGLAMSQNKIFWVLVSSCNVNYDSPKGITYLTVYAPKFKIFKSLIDSTGSGLIDKILLEFKDVALNEIFDLLELKKLELFNGSSKFCETYTLDGDLPLLGLQLLLWEVKLKLTCNLIETEVAVSEIEYCIIKTYIKKVVEDLQKADSLTPVQSKSLKLCEMFLKEDSIRNNLVNETCPVCANECIFYNTRTLSCPNHKFPRCCLSLLPCDVVPYAFCRLCDAVALKSFVSENNRRCPYCDGLLETDSRILPFT